MVQYLPPTAVLSIFNPASFRVVGTTVNNTDEVALLQAQTNTLTTNIATETTKFNNIISLPSIIINGYTHPFTYEGTIFASNPPTESFLPLPTLSSNYYWIASITWNFAQSNSSGSYISIQGIECYNTWTQNYTGWTGLGSTNNINPAFQMTLTGLGTNIQPTFTFRLPLFNSTYATNPNNFTLSGNWTLIGIQKPTG